MRAVGQPLWSPCCSVRWRPHVRGADRVRRLHGADHATTAPRSRSSATAPRGARDDRLRLRRRCRTTASSATSPYAPTSPRKDGYDRVYPLDVVSVSGVGGHARRSTPSRTTATTSASRSAIPTRTITGEHTYEITYRVRGALNALRRPRRAGVERDRRPSGRCRSSAASAVVHAPAAITSGRVHAGPLRLHAAVRRRRDVRANRRASFAVTQLGSVPGHDGHRRDPEGCGGAAHRSRSSRSGSTSRRRSG